MSEAHGYLHETCRMGNGAETCRYIVADVEGLHCAKLNRGLADQIDRRVAAGVFVAQGDNCPGRPMEDQL